MPSPIAHALAGCAVGWLASPDECRVIQRPPPSDAGLTGLLKGYRWPLAFIAAGVAADLDLLVGLHSRYTHSVGAVLVVFAVSWVLSGGVRQRSWVAATLALSYASHLLLDWLGRDTAPPLGIMALWPFSDLFYVSPVSVFMGISRRYWLAAAWWQNAMSVSRELLLLLPLAGLAFWARPPKRR